MCIFRVEQLIEQLSRNSTLYRPGETLDSSA